MPARVRVKICGVTSPSDARRIAEAGADAIGIVFWPKSPRFVTPRRAREIVRALPPWVAAVGVFVDEDASAIAAVARMAGLSACQLHGDEPPAVARLLSAWKVLKAFRVRAAADLCRVRAYPADAYLFDARSPRGPGGTGETLPWRILRGRSFGRPFVLAGGLDPDNAALAIRVANPWGVDVSSGVESRPGRKDMGKVRAFLEAVASASARQPRTGMP